MYVFLVDAKIFQSKNRFIKPTGKNSVSPYTYRHYYASHLLVITPAGVAGHLPAVYRDFGINVKTIRVQKMRLFSMSVKLRSGRIKITN
jgi:hypothetical protein